MANVLKFAYAGGYDQAAIDALAVAMDIAVEAYWLPLCHPNLSYLNVTVKGLQDIIDMFAVEDTMAGPGQSGGSPLPNNVTWAMRFTTGATGRSSRGRMFVCGLNSGVVDETTNTITEAHANNWVSALVQTAADAAIEGWQHCIVSRFTEGAARDQGTYRIVTGVGYHDRGLDSQRGRLPSSG